MLARSDREDLERLAAALVVLGAFLRIGAMSDEEARSLPVIIDGRALAGMETSTWRTTAGDLDRIGYETLEPRGTVIEIVGVEVRISGLTDVVASKRFAGREKDQDAMPETRTPPARGRLKLDLTTRRGGVPRHFGGIDGAAMARKWRENFP